ncbi:MAG: homocysteine S-methyltransferase family protein [Anaerovoracaceae bacterium]|nr:homocysteine S-methyltransferase family protein [Anaerovoracaceae bacterium]
MAERNILDALGKRILFFDGGMGSMLQQKGMIPGENTDIWNITRPEDIQDVQRQYVAAGCDILLANMFGANRLKLEGTGYTAEEIICAAVKNARMAAADAGEGRQIFVGADVSSTGRLLQPLGDLSFDEACDIYREIVTAAEKAGADFIHIETMSDMLELKAAVLTAKEYTSLPVFATVTFDQSGKMLTGGNPEAVVAMLEGLGVDALGTNCGLGPYQLENVVKNLLRAASVPVIVQPNAGLPRQENGQTVYDVGPADFAEKMRQFAEEGAWLLGGCCGTTPEHIRMLKEACGEITPKPITDKGRTVVSSYTHAVVVADDPIIIGERINPTGKSRLKQALRDHDMDYILQEGFSQQDKGAHILDINVGLPEIDEPSMILDVVREVQSVIDLPLQIDTANVKAMEQALRYYNGKAMINSVSGKQESMEAVFPLVKKYGGILRDCQEGYHHGCALHDHQFGSAGCGDDAAGTEDGEGEAGRPDVSGCVQYFLRSAAAGYHQCQFLRTGAGCRAGLCHPEYQCRRHAAGIPCLPRPCRQGRKLREVYRDLCGYHGTDCSTSGIFRGGSISGIFCGRTGSGGAGSIRFCRSGQSGGVRFGSGAGHRQGSEGAGRSSGGGAGEDHRTADSDQHPAGAGAGYRGKGFRSRNRIPAAAADECGSGQGGLRSSAQRHEPHRRCQPDEKG